MFVYSCVSLPQHALNLCRVNLAQKLQIVIIVSRENILHTSPSLLVFHSLNPNLFFLLLATYHSFPHILDTLVLTISIFPSLPFQIIQQKPISRSPYMGTCTIFLLWQRNTLWFASHHNNITIMEYFIPENIHITCMDKLKTPPPPSSWTSGASCSRLG